jgi:hypothetical protein
VIRTGAHLVRRFAGSLVPGGPAAPEEQWARRQLLPGERALWGRLSGADRRHAAGVARAVEETLGADATRPVLAAALLHDVGKLDAGLGVWGRVAATVVGLAGGRDRAAGWEERGGPTGRVGRYLRHPERGAVMLGEAGSHELTVAWARCHHTPPERWDPVIPAATGSALKRCDDD